MMTNPVLYREGLPLFDQINPDHISPALESILKEANIYQGFAESVKKEKEDVTKKWES